MRTKNLYLIILFQIVALCSWAQGIDDIFGREKTTTEKIEKDESEEITMVVDTAVSQGKISEELEQAKQDSIKQINDKWENYWIEQNQKIQQLDKAIQQIDPSKITKKEIKDFELQVNRLKSDFEKRKETNCLWQNNADLDKMRDDFDSSCDAVLSELDSRKEEGSSSTDMLIILGICLAVVMVAVPIFTQIKAGVMVRKAKKEQERQAKQQQEEIERQMLLTDENNMITLKE